MLVTSLRRIVEPLPDAARIGYLRFDRCAPARVVLLGETLNGTSTVCRAHAAIPRRPIEKHGLTIVGVASEQPTAAAPDRCTGRRHDPAAGRSWLIDHLSA